MFSEVLGPRIVGTHRELVEHHVYHYLLLVIIIFVLLNGHYHQVGKCKIIQLNHTRLESNDCLYQSLSFSLAGRHMIMICLLLEGKEGS